MNEDMYEKIREDVRDDSDLMERAGEDLAKRKLIDEINSLQGKVDTTTYNLSFYKDRLRTLTKRFKENFK